MSILGLLAVIASVVFGIKSGNSDFFILSGLLFIGTCLLDIPRLIHRNTLKRMQIIAETLADMLENIRVGMKDEEDMTEEEKMRQAIVNGIVAKYMDDKDNS